MRPGGISDSEKDAGPEVQGYVETLAKEIREGATSSLASSGGNGSSNSKLFENAKLTAVKYKTQVVAGTNYFVKIKVGDNHVFFARIYRDLQGNVSLNKVVGPKGIDDSIEYF